jgi:hypothetical protein
MQRMNLMTRPILPSNTVSVENICRTEPAPPLRGQMQITTTAFQAATDTRRQLDG